ncbi:MAG: hypothetical protein DHS20C13_28160 [Thermodesulfobacteriota bacterium]|nr:MAG: hypothetical protein DHS20C13_28160 [Thermodesulfobacteriota bacterium]
MTNATYSNDALPEYRTGRSFSIKNKPYVTFLLGAGASYDAGLPLANDLFSEVYISEVHRLSKNGDKNRLKEVINIINAFQEDEFGLQAQYDKWLVNGDSNAIEIFLSAISDVMFWAETAAHCTDDGKRDVRPLDYLFAFNSFLNALKESGREVAVISMNYDLNVEASRFYDHMNYGQISGQMIWLNRFQSGLKEFSEGITILKPHGSLNWLVCDQCRKITAGKDNLWQAQKSISVLKTCCACKEGKIHPLFVPPVNSVRAKVLEPIWDDIGEVLDSTELFVVAGYSFPEYDLYVGDRIRKALSSKSNVLIIDPFVFENSERYQDLGDKHPAGLAMRFADIFMDIFEESKSGYNESGDFDRPENTNLFSVFKNARQLYPKKYQLDKQFRLLSNPDLHYIYIATQAKKAGQYEKACEYLLQSIKIRKEKGVNKHSEKLLLHLGINYQLLGEYETALDYYDQALNAIDGESNPANIHYQVGRIHQLLGNNDKALSCWETALQLAKQCNNSETQANAIQQLGFIHQERGEYDEATELYLRSLDIRTAQNSHDGMGHSYHQLGTVSQMKGEYDKAQSFYERALEIRHILGNQRDISCTLGQMGTIALKKEKLDTAESLYKQSLQISTAIKDRESIAIVFHNIGHLKLQQNKTLDALKWLAQSVNMYQQLGNLPSAVKTLKELIDVLCEAENYQEALECAREALNLSKQMDDQDNIVQLTIKKGYVHLMLKSPKKAVRSYHEALALLEKTQDKKWRAVCHNFLGFAEWENNNKPKAYHHFEQVLQYSQTIDENDNIYYGSHVDIGSLAENDNNTSVARQHYEQALRIIKALDVKEEEACVHMTLGFLADSVDDYVTSLFHFQAALAFHESVKNTELVNMIGDLIAKTKQEMGYDARIHGKVH